ncbi:MAG: restriction endonuclease subunit S [Fibrobacteres bacterium]|nr:restriction endonuclease subunit S [Fibrobacterota bacterium]
MSEDFQEGWIVASIQELVEKKRYSLAIGPFGSDLKVSDYRESGRPLVFVREIRARRFQDEKTKYVSEEKFEELCAHRVAGGDLLVTKMGDPPGDVAEYPMHLPEAVITADCIKLSVDANLALPSYVYFGLQSEFFRQQVLEISAGVAHQKVTLENFRNLHLPLAPLPEQRRIVAKLDALQSRTRIAREALDAVTPLLKSFRQSVLQAAVTGALTEEWRLKMVCSETGKEFIHQDLKRKQRMLNDDPVLAKKKSSANSEVDQEYVFDVPVSWGISSWGAISEWITYGFTRPMPSTPSGVKLVTAKDVHPFDLRLDRSGFTTQSAFDSLSGKDKPKQGDLLITKDGTIGRAAVLKSEVPFCINQSVAVCWLRSTQMEKAYLELVANAHFTQKFVIEKAKGMAIQHLSITDFAQCPVPVPPLAEQTEIVRRVQHLFAMADAMEVEFAAAQRSVEQLDQSLLATAFRGELVPQDPSDEPASVLLERIRAARAALPDTKGKRGRKPGETPSVARLASEDLSPSPNAPKKRGRPGKVSS